MPGRGRLPTKGSHEDKTPRVARNPLPAWAAALSGTTGDLRSHTSSLSSTSVNGILMTMEKHYAKRGHVSHGGGVLRLQYTEPRSVSNKPLVLGMWVLTSETRLRNHPTSYKICLSPSKTLVGVSISGSAISDQLAHQADFTFLSASPEEAYLKRLEPLQGTLAALPLPSSISLPISLHFARFFSSFCHSFSQNGWL